MCYSKLSRIHGIQRVRERNAPSFGWFWFWNMNSVNFVTSNSGYQFWARARIFWSVYDTYNELKLINENCSFTCSAVFNRFSISKLLVRLVCFTADGMFCGSADDGAGELSISGENVSLPIEETIWSQELWIKIEKISRRLMIDKERS